MHFCNWILQAVHNSLLDPKLTFLLMKLGSICMGISVLRPIGVGEVLI
jgi:hypothetical protein